MKIRAIITGSTGMVGEGVLLECLQHPDIESILVINRRPCGIVHTKLTEIIHADFFNLSPVETGLKGYNACFFCAGTTSLGKKEPEYTRVTYDLTLGFAQKLSKLNPDLTFCYVSGAGTDSSEKGSLMWARVKGRTENDLMKLFTKTYAFRPAFMKSVDGQRHTPKMYKYVEWLYYVLHPVIPNYFGKLSDVALAMIYCAKFGYKKNVLEVKDIIDAAFALKKQQGSVA